MTRSALHHSNASAVKLAAAPQKAAEEMIAIINTLHSVYQEETDALANTDTRGFNALQDKKMNAARKYEQGIAQIIQRRDEMQNVSPDIKKQLRAMQNDFAELANKNKLLLERMQRTTARLGETIRHAAKDVVTKRSATGYSAEGALRPPKTRNMSVGINETA